MRILAVDRPWIIIVLRRIWRYEGAMDTRRITALLKWRRAPWSSRAEIFVLVNHCPDNAHVCQTSYYFLRTLNFSIIRPLNGIVVELPRVNDGATVSTWEIDYRRSIPEYQWFYCRVIFIEPSRYNYRSMFGILICDGQIKKHVVIWTKTLPD